MNVSSVSHDVHIVTCIRNSGQVFYDIIFGLFSGTHIHMSILNSIHTQSIAVLYIGKYKTKKMAPLIRSHLPGVHSFWWAWQYHQQLCGWPELCVVISMIQGMQT